MGLNAAIDFVVFDTFDIVELLQTVLFVNLNIVVHHAAFLVFDADGRNY
jgi:hypothetical protein